ncbi:GntR family transcriptional regulator/MocR family aminotransferase [Kibdelosporangium banguiense]|uniref:GntR family transcriptional regulator/MocR family aminotransferase n=1 Tax=Kibdelosporangium banguiense TaxID=1365924 RepID=A0ABS4U1A9_9PSEU|nr:PLP-dependent aminotransferase family protein [Kibdelosporangium banguiense]MBP2330421.1 GntR family transcriptional regulator/MocR family aminotransferase [Kibdelosporangium banguiense]
MPVEQTNEPPELLLRFDVGTRPPGMQQLVRALREAIRAGRLLPGARLPASRLLARQLGCSRWVVVQAYEQLIAEGYLDARVGSGTRVHQLPAASPAAEEVAVQARSWRFDFRPGIPDLAHFPRAAWLRAVRASFLAAPTADLDYGDLEGLPALRSGLADYLGRVRGVQAQAGDISVTTGSVNALSLVARALTARGVTRIGVENPSWIPLREPLAGSGIETVALAVDGDGLVVEDVVRSGVGAVLVTPVHQFPTGTVLSPDRRRQLLEWAAERDALVVEDDYDSEYRYDRTPLGAIQGVAPDHVLLIGTVSKSLAPALRLGWMVAPPRLAAHLRRARQSVDVGVSVLTQLAFARFLESGAFEQHLRRMRKEYHGRRTSLVSALEQHFPDSRVHGIAGGLHLMVELGVPVSGEEIERACDAQGIRLYSLHRYCAGEVPAQYSQSTVVLGFGGIPAHRMNTAIATMADLLLTPAAGTPRRAPR